MQLKTDTGKERKERRRFSRRKIQGYCHIDRSPERYKIVDISPGGLRVCCPRKIEGGQKVEIFINLKNGYQFETNAYVVWTMEFSSKDQKQYEIGLAFEDMTIWDSHQLKVLVGTD